MTPSGTNSIAAFADVEIKANPNLGFVFDQWKGDCSGTGDCQVKMTAVKSVTAVFKAEKYTLTVAAIPPEGGSIVPSKQDDSYGAGTEVKITATSKDGYDFTGWSGACSGTGDCQVAMTANKSVTANFKAINFTLTTAIEPTEGGSVDPPEGDATYAGNTTVLITATPKEGWVFVSWAGDCSTKTNSCLLGMSANKSVTAKFSQRFNLKLTRSPVAGGFFLP